MSLYPKYLRHVKGYQFAITGSCWLTRNALIAKIKKNGGKLSKRRAQVTNTTDVLILGKSNSWAFRNYGRKEFKVANYLKKGKIIVTVHDSDFQDLLERGKPAKTLDRIAGQPIEWYLPKIKKEKYFKIIKSPGTLDREHTTKGRLEQKYLREQLFGDKESVTCSICGKLFPVEIMVAGHIKPRSECNLSEKKDFLNIVFPVCLLGCDALYEKGLISVNNKGIIKTSRVFNNLIFLNKILNKVNGKKCLAWNENNKTYFAWHYERIFQL